MKNRLIIGITVGFIAGLVLSVNAGQAAHSIESCSALLPEGKTFTFSIQGNINTQGSEPEVNGEFSLSDGTNSNDPEMGEAVQPFVECVSALIE